MRCPPDEQLIGLRDERLSETERETLREHVASCPSCRGRLARGNGPLEATLTPAPFRAGPSGPDQKSAPPLAEGARLPASKGAPNEEADEAVNGASAPEAEAPASP